MTQTIDTPKIYVGTYSKYNNGSLKGEWVDLSDFSSKEDFYTYCNELHNDEIDPELMFQDWENDPADFISESGVNSKLWDYLEEIDTLDSTEAEAYKAYKKNDSSRSIDDFKEDYSGEWDSEQAFAENLISECYDLEKTMGNLSYYFDYEKYSRDLFMTDYNFIDGFVFRNS